MWLKFPEGATSVSVAGMEFNVEAKDSEGRGYFRIHENLAPQVLELPGFLKAEPKDTDLKDFQIEDPERSDAIQTLSAKVSAQRLEIEGLQNANTELLEERKKLLNKITELEKPKDTEDTAKRK